MSQEGSGRPVDAVAVASTMDGRFVSLKLKSGSDERGLLLEPDVLSHLYAMIPGALHRAKQDRQKAGILDRVGLDDVQVPEINLLSDASVVKVGTGVRMTLELSGLRIVAVVMSEEQAAQLSRSLRKPKAARRQG